MFAQRCVRCKIKREDCPGIGRKCDKFHRSDRKTIYWRLLRIVGGFKGVETLGFNYNGTIAGVKVEAAPDSNNKRLATYRKSRKFAPWLKDNH